MRKIEVVEVGDDAGLLQAFNNLPSTLYDENSQRFKLGNDPDLESVHSLFVVMESGSCLARAAYYKSSNLVYEGKSSSCIGSFESVDDEEVCRCLIDHVTALALRDGCKFIIGPMEGSTWNNYRFSVHNKEANFFMEPYHHIYYNRLFEDSGFEVIAKYISNKDSELKYDADQLSQFEDYFKDKGAKFRNLNINDLEADLYKIARFSIAAFSDNFLYSPITDKYFVDKYLKLKDLFNPKYVWLVEDDSGELHALLFAIPDYNDATGKTLIIKSMARRKDSPFKGIGNYIGGKMTQIAAENGFEQVVHAMMISSNASVNVSKKYQGEAFKKYHLYGKAL